MFIPKGVSAWDETDERRKLSKNVNLA